MKVTNVCKFLQEPLSLTYNRRITASFKTYICCSAYIICTYHLRSQEILLAVVSNRNDSSIQGFALSDQWCIDLCSYYYTFQKGIADYCVTPLDLGWTVVWSVLLV